MVDGLRPPALPPRFADPQPDLPGVLRKNSSNACIFRFPVGIAAIYR